MHQVRICPTVDVFNLEDYREQILRIQSFAKYVHVDAMDGEFAPVRSPELRDMWWPHDMIAYIHLMYQRPMDYLQELVRLKPYMVILQAESSVHHMHMSAELHRHGIRTGISILQETPVDNIKQIMHSFDQVLVFSGHLGYQGGVIDLGLLHKVREIKAYYPEVEVAWDGGVNDQNIQELVAAGVTVCNAGGFIQKASNPEAAYATLKALAQQKTPED